MDTAGRGEGVDREGRRERGELKRAEGVRRLVGGERVGLKEEERGSGGRSKTKRRGEWTEEWIDGRAERRRERGSVRR